MASDGLEDEVVDERRGTFKRGDFYKMHAYRDAIDGARSVWIRYPGTECRFFPADGAIVESLMDPLPPGLDGVGAIPMAPADVQQPALDVVLTRMLGRDDVSLC